jgi:anti-repressor protein
MSLTVIENELVPVYETDEGIQVVNGRELHQVLKSGQDFSTWVKKRLNECDAEENKDYDLFHNSVEQLSGTKYRIIDNINQ